MAELISIRVHDSYIDRTYIEDGKTWLHRYDRTAAGILETNKLMRLEPEAIRPMDGMKWALSIPVDDLQMLKGQYPDLASSDGHTKHKAYQKFMRSPMSEPYRVYEPSTRGATA